VTPVTVGSLVERHSDNAVPEFIEVLDRTMPDNLLDLFPSATEDYGIILLDADGRVHRWSRGQSGYLDIRPMR
jgi:hypothetical protein